MVIFEHPDPTEPTLLAIADFDGSPPLELHLRDGFAMWLDDEGNVLAIVELGEA